MCVYIYIYVVVDIYTKYVYIYRCIYIYIYYISKIYIYICIYVYIYVVVDSCLAGASRTHGLVALSDRASERSSLTVGSTPTQTNFLWLLLKSTQW